MATATKKVLEIKPPVEITLTLSEEEAQTLAAILGRVGGSGPRKHADTMRAALQQIGYDYNNGNPMYTDTLAKSNGLYF